MYKRRPLDRDIRAQLFEDAQHFRSRLRAMRAVTTREEYLRRRSLANATWRKGRDEIVAEERELHRDLADILKRAEALMRGKMDPTRPN